MLKVRLDVLVLVSIVIWAIFGGLRQPPLVEVDTLVSPSTPQGGSQSAYPTLPPPCNCSTVPVSSSSPVPGEKEMTPEGDQQTVAITSLINSDWSTLKLNTTIRKIDARRPSVASSSSSSSSPSETFEGAFDDLLNDMAEQTDVFGTHDRYLLLQAFLQQKMNAKRQDIIKDQNRTQCAEFLRREHRAGDSIYRVPCVPWNTSRLASVQSHPFGLWARFRSVPPKDPKFRIAVEMSGHMRTFRKCRDSLKKNLLASNTATLFVSTYPDIGDKRFGVRVQDRDDPVPMDELADSYAPHLGGVFIADLPTIRKQLQQAFPHLFHLQQWSWMIYQLFMMEVAHNITVAHYQPSLWEVSVLDSSNKENQEGVHELFATTSSEGSPLFHIPEGDPFHVFVRVRPDLYIIGPIHIIPLNSSSAQFEVECGDTKMKDVFHADNILRTTHHPVYEWSLDPLSDHSAVGFFSNMTAFLRLYSFAERLDPKEQERKIFFAGNTAERMWSQHVDRQKLKVIRTYGWHVMLRNKAKWHNSTVTVAKTQRRAEIIQKIFGVTNPSGVGCPRPDKGMVVFHKPKPGKGPKRAH